MFIRVVEPLLPAFEDDILRNYLRVLGICRGERPFAPAGRFISARAGIL